ncbi:MULTISPECIES: amidohydrolase family protein [Streptomyces]|uniref:amidohydrolase family protein n=1 Tax=Streptomyces TaxID=1883 RepID=UPI0004BD225E|nr:MULTISPECIES: amidohydrolase family protein [Streptomyces]
MSAGVDAHVHLWDRSVNPQDWIDAETMAPIARDFDASDLSGMLASTGLDRAVVVQSSNSLEESIWLAGLDSPVVAGLVAWVDLAAEVGPQLDRIRMNAAVPVVGVRHLTRIDPDPQWMMREEVSAGLTVLEREGLRFDLVVREWQLPQAIHLATRHSGLRFVLDHLGGPPEPGQNRSGWASRLRELARRPNVVAKVSGLTSGLAPGSWCAADLAASVTVAVESFGPERLLYGSDWPLAELGGGAAPWKSAVEALLDGLSTVERARVFGGNAADVYSLS